MAFHNFTTCKTVLLKQPLFGVSVRGFFQRGLFRLVGRISAQKRFLRFFRNWSRTLSFGGFGRNRARTGSPCFELLSLLGIFTLSSSFVRLWTEPFGLQNSSLSALNHLFLQRKETDTVIIEQQG